MREPSVVPWCSIDAGAAGDFDPPLTFHYYLLGSGKYGVTQLANLASVPPTGALLVIAPLKLVGGPGSPVRALGLVTLPEIREVRFLGD